MSADTPRSGSRTRAAAGSARALAAALLLAAPAVLAFRAGGYFDEPRLWAGLAACGLLAVAALCAPLPRSRWTWLAAAGLAGLAGWTLWSAEWAPLYGPALADAQRVALYAVGFLAAALLLGALPRAVEPGLALGALAVVGYGLAGRLLPGLVEQEVSRTALGRLEQPLTYWNALGALAAIGVVLSVRLAGDGTRAAALRAAGAAGAVPLGLGLVLTFSRGALVALAIGLAALCVAAPARAQFRAVAVAVAAIVLAGAVALPLDGVRALGGEEGRREAEGAVMLAAVAALMAGAALAAVRPPVRGDLRRPGLAASAAAGLALLLAGALAVSGAGPSSATPAAGADPARLASADSNRYRYWRVALDSFAAHPLRGVGSGGFRVEWRRERDVDDPARDAHSLYLETAAELGLVGLALLGAAVAGIAGGALAARRRAAAAAAGPLAALCVWAVHAGIDWDWEMPALTLVALALAGALAALSRPREPAG